LGESAPSRSRGAFARFRTGAAAPIEGVRYLVARPPLWGWAAFPVVLMLVLLALSLWAVVAGTPDFVGWLWPSPPRGRFAGLRFALTVVLGFSVFVFLAVVMWVVSGIVEGDGFPGARLTTSATPG
jgi:hypothetical protein